MGKINFKNGRIEDYTIVLSTRDYRHLGQLTGIKSETVQHNVNLNSANEFSFTLCKVDVLHLSEVYNEETRKRLLLERNRLWELLVDHKLVWVKELDEYYEIKVSTDDSVKETIKTVTCTSLCEAELSQYIYKGLEINTAEDMDLKSGHTLFYKANDTSHSLLHRAIKDRAPHYSIGYVDPSLQNLTLVREFSVSGTSVYDFLTGEVAEQYHCIFVFDSRTRTISAYDLYTTCNATVEKTDENGNKITTICGHRGEFYDECPECRNTDITKMTYFGKDTSILIDKNNLTDSIKLETNADSVKNCLRLVAGDELMTATIRTLNPNGSDYLYYINETQMKDMPENLVSKLKEYQKKYDDNVDTYENLVLEYYDLLDKIYYLEHSMMPKSELSNLNEINAKTEADALIKAFTNPDDPPMLALNVVTSKDNPSKATVNSAMENYAKVFIKSGYVKVEANGEFSYVGEYEGENKIEDSKTKYHYGYWTGTFKITNYSDKEDVVATQEFTIKVTDDRVTYAEQKVLKNMAKSDDDCTIYNIFSEKDDVKFKEALKYYSYARLKSFSNAYEAAIDVLNAMGLDGNIIEDTKDPNYDAEKNAMTKGLYYSYQTRYGLCEEAMNRIQTNKEFEFSMNDKNYTGCIEGFKSEYDIVLSKMETINKDLNFETNLGTELYKIYCSYRREDTYENQNYFSDGIKSNVEIIDKAKDFIAAAKKELERVANPQYTISSTLNNFLVLDEFKPILNHFELGNWIRVKIDGQVYRLRLIGYSIDFGNLQTINVEFSTVTKCQDVAYDAQQILKSAQSMSTSFTYVAQQSKKGESAKTKIDDWVENGLNSALVNIKNDDETLLINDNGMLFRYLDPDTKEYSPEQMKIYHNILLFTQNNWETCSQAIGKHDYTIYNEKTNEFETCTGYGMTAEFVTAPSIMGTTLIGGKIYSSNYKIETDENDPRGKDPCGTLIDLNEGTFSFAGEKLTFDGKNLFIDEHAVGIAISNLDATASNLKVNASKIQGNIDSEQLSSIPLSKIEGTSEGKIVSSQIESITVSQISDSIPLTKISGTYDGKITKDQIVTLPLSKIEGTSNGKIVSDQIESINIGKINGTVNDKIQSEQIEDDLNNKNVTGTFEGSVVLSDVTTTSNGQTYTTVSGEFTVGEMKLTFINGLLVKAE